MEDSNAHQPDEAGCVCEWVVGPYGVIFMTQQNNDVSVFASHP